MNFASIRIITEHTKRLVGFYEQVTGLKANWSTEDFAEIRFANFTLAIAHKKTTDMFNLGAAHAADNHSAILELRVADVDADFKRLQAVVSSFVQEPVTQPWGNRSLLFRDPDGNLINLFAPVTDQAKARLDGK